MAKGVKLRKLEEKLIWLFVFFLFFAGLFFISRDHPGVGSSSLNSIEVNFFDVGQGDATLVQKDKTQVLIDGGPDKSILLGLGQEIPLLDKEIEAIILSHPHSDHLAGLNYVLQRYSVKNIYLLGVSHQTPEFNDFVEEIKRKKIHTKIVWANDNFQIGDLNFEFFWPTKDGLSPDLNEDSLVFNVSYRGRKILFTGDVSGKKLEEIADVIGDIDILKVPHHGSKSSLTPLFLEKTKPEYAVISCGRNNEFGHPHQETLNLLGRYFVKVFRTDRIGNIEFFVEESMIKF